MEDKIIELYGLNQDIAALLRKEADVCRKNFTIKSSDSFHSEIIGTFVRTLENFSQQDLAKSKEVSKKVCAL